MRHRIAGVRLSRTSAHRKALFSNLIAALFYNERIRTTDAKAKETRRLAERTITWARRVSDVLGKKPDRRTIDESSRVVHAVRMARRVVRDRGAVLKLFDELAPRYLRPPGRLHAHREAAPAAGRRRADVAAGADARGGGGAAAKPAGKGEKGEGRQGRRARPRRPARAAEGRRPRAAEKPAKAKSRPAEP